MGRYCVRWDENKGEGEEMSAYIEGSPDCCGMDILCEVYNESPNDIVCYVRGYYRSGESGHTNSWLPVPFLIFSGTKEQNVEKLSAFIKAKKLGLVRTSTRKYNPNSGNYLRVYIWEINRKALYAYEGQPK